MDAQQQQPQRFMGAPPPPPPQSAMPDPQQQTRLQAPPPPPPQGTWYPSQFQYNTPQPPPPSHPHQSTWPNHSDHQQPLSSSSYPPPHQYNPVPPYPTHPPPPQPQNQYYPPPPPQQHASYSQAYPQPNTHQAWGNPNWAHSQVWEHPDRNNPNSNEEDWAAKARAWSAAKSAMDSQHQPLHFTPTGRPDEHNHVFQDQYQRTVDPHYGNIHRSSLPASSHQQFSVPTGDPHRVPVNHLHESSFRSESSSYYSSDMHVPYANRDGTQGSDPNSLHPHHGSYPTNISGYQQEVPSSYSSVPGEREVGNQGVQLHAASASPISSGQEAQYHVNPALPDFGRSVSEEQPYYTYGAASAGSLPDPSDRPLEFAPGFNHNQETHDQHPHSSYMHLDPAPPVGYVDHGVAAPSLSSLTPSVVPGMGYSASGLQFDPSFVSSAPMFGQIPGSSYRPNVPSGGAAFGLGTGAVFHPTAAFPGDPNGIGGVSDRPKKASVPTWLREEIIKNKAVIASSTQERLEDDRDNHNEDDDIENSFVKHDLADNKNIDSSRSSEDEEDDEDAIEAARTAAVNQEIKRVLTEVLLKVTDELFDEIATNVLEDDAMAVEVDHSCTPPNRKLSPSPPPKASTKVLLPVKVKETVSNDDNGKSPSGSAGDVLGLGSYASDDDDYDAPPPQAGTKLSVDIREAVENGSSQVENKVPSGEDENKTDGIRDKESGKTNGSSVYHKGDKISQEGTTIAGGEDMEATNNLKSEDAVGIKPDKNQEEENGDSKQSDTGELRREERHSRKEKTDEKNGTNDRGDKARESESRRSHTKNDKTQTEKVKKDSAKDESSRKRVREKDEKEDKARHYSSRDSSSHKRRQSPSVGGRVRNSKDNASSDDASEDSRRSRKKHSRKRSSSPSPTRSRKHSSSLSPTRSRRRQVSRSPPHSKHHHRRHSPSHSSLNTKRGRRSRSRSRSNSPVRRRR